MAVCTIRNALPVKLVTGAVHGADITTSSIPHISNPMLTRGAVQDYLSKIVGSHVICFAFILDRHHVPENYSCFKLGFKVSMKQRKRLFPVCDVYPSETTKAGLNFVNRHLIGSLKGKRFECQLAICQSLQPHPAIPPDQR